MYRMILTLAVVIALSAATMLPAAAGHPRGRGGYVVHPPRGGVYGGGYRYGGYYSYPGATYHHYRSMHHYGYPSPYYGSYYPSYYGRGYVGVYVPGFSLSIGY